MNSMKHNLTRNSKSTPESKSLLENCGEISSGSYHALCCVKEIEKHDHNYRLKTVNNVQYASEVKFYLCVGRILKEKHVCACTYTHTPLD